MILYKNTNIGIEISNIGLQTKAKSRETSLQRPIVDENKTQIFECKRVP